jgi:predicted RNase H-like nuclease (RuvC/YqgF family)
MSISENWFVPPRPASSHRIPERIIPTVGGGVRDLDQERATLEVRATHLREDSQKLSERLEVLRRRVATSDPGNRRYMTLVGTSVDLDDELARTERRAHKVEVELVETETKLDAVGKLIAAFDAQQSAERQ